MLVSASSSYRRVAPELAAPYGRDSDTGAENPRLPYGSMRRTPTAGIYLSGTPAVLD